MTPVHLHFEPPRAAGLPHRWRVTSRSATLRQRWLLAVTLCLAGLACLVLAWRLWGLQAELARSTGTLQTMTSGTTAKRSASPAADPTLSPRERAAWARLTGALNTPWNGVFDTLERAIPTDVALISIEPDASTDSLRLEAEAPTLDALLNAVRALGKSEGIDRVALVKHETHERHPDRPVRLVVHVHLRRETP